MVCVCDGRTGLWLELPELTCVGIFADQIILQALRHDKDRHT